MAIVNGAPGAEPSGSPALTTLALSQDIVEELAVCDGIMARSTSRPRLRCPRSCRAQPEAQQVDVRDEVGGREREAQRQAEQAGAIATQGKEAAPELPERLENEVLRLRPHAAGVQRGRLEARVAALLGPELPPGGVVVVHQPVDKPLAGTIEQDELMHRPGRIVPPAVAPEEPELVIGVPAGAAHPAPQDEVLPRHPEAYRRARGAGAQRTLGRRDARGGLAR